MNIIVLLKIQKCISRSFQKQVEIVKDVERALSDFSSCNRVPPFINEACIFRRTYFVNQFLPALLNYEGSVDGSQALLEELKRKGLVSASSSSHQQQAKKSKC